MIIFFLSLHENGTGDYTIEWCGPIFFAISAKVIRCDVDVVNKLDLHLKLLTPRRVTVAAAGGGYTFLVIAKHVKVEFYHVLFVNRFAHGNCLISSFPIEINIIKLHSSLKERFFFPLIPSFSNVPYSLILFTACLLIFFSPFLMCTFCTLFLFLFIWSFAIAKMRPRSLIWMIPKERKKFWVHETDSA